MLPGVADRAGRGRRAHREDRRRGRRLVHRVGGPCGTLAAEVEPGPATRGPGSRPVCGSRTILESSGKKNIKLDKLLNDAFESVNVRRLDSVKGVKGLISEDKFPEPLEKGILRARNDVYTYRDGTIRHDSTDLPMTHFIPREVGVPYERIVEMGYTEDIYGDPITSDNQIVEIIQFLYPAFFF